MRLRCLSVLVAHSIYDPICSRRTRFPVAVKTALPTVPASGDTPGSLMPSGGSVLGARRTLDIRAVVDAGHAIIVKTALLQGALLTRDFAGPHGRQREINRPFQQARTPSGFRGRLRTAVPCRP